MGLWALQVPSLSLLPFGIFPSPNQGPCTRGGRSGLEELRVESCTSALWSWQPLVVVQGELLPFLS